MCDFSLAAVRQILSHPNSPASTKCISDIAAKSVSYVIMAGAVGLKVPQILNIVSTSSVDGLSAMSFYSEVPAYMTTVIYNIEEKSPIENYGEAIIILIQNVILVVLLWIYIRPRPSLLEILGVSSLFLAIYLGNCYAPKVIADLICSNANQCTEKSIRDYLFTLLSNGLVISSRVPQIVKNYKESSTGQLSTITTFLIFGGTVARILTTIKANGYNWALLSGLFLSLLLSTTLLLQMWFYSSSRRKHVIKEIEKKKK